MDQLAGIDWNPFTNPGDLFMPGVILVCGVGASIAWAWNHLRHRDR